MHKQASHTRLLALYFVAVLVNILSLNPAHSSSIQQVDFDSMAKAAELIIDAEVVSVESQWDASNRQIHTYVVFRVNDVIKGTLADSQIRLRFLGGQVGADELRVEGVIYPRVAERGVYFIETTQRNLVNPLIGWSQGHYIISQDNRVRSNQGQAVTTVDQAPSVSPSRLSTGVAVGLERLPQDRSDDALTTSQFKRKILLSLEK